MIHVILDTNSLESNRKSAEFQALEKLCEHGEVQVHIPYVVQQEYLTYQKNKAESAVKSIVNGFQRFRAERAARQPELLDLMASLTEQIDALQTRYLATVEQEFLQWGQRLNIQFHACAPHHGEAVLQAYFKVNLPFIKKNQKENIPDAFIWQTVLDVLRDYRTVHLISNNHRDFQAVCAETPNVVLHQALADFLSNPQIQDLRMGQFIEQHFDAIIDVFRQKESYLLPKLVEQFDRIFSIGQHEIVKDILGQPDAQILSVGYPIEQKWAVTIQYERAKHFGYGFITLPVVIDIHPVKIHYSQTFTFPVPQPPSPYLQDVHIEPDGSVIWFMTKCVQLQFHTDIDVALPDSPTEPYTPNTLANKIEQFFFEINMMGEVEAIEITEKGEPVIDEN